MEIFANIFSLFAVFLTVRQNVLAFPVGMVGMVAYAVLFAQQGWYGNVALQVVFVAQSLYGWYHWKFGRVGVKRELPVTRLKWLDRIWWVMVIGMVFPAAGWLFLRMGEWGWFQRYAVQQLAYADAFTLTVSLLAQWLVAQKKVENWPLWIVADIIYVGMFIYSSLWVSAATYAIFAGMAVWGWREWRTQVILPLPRR